MYHLLHTIIAKNLSELSQQKKFSFYVGWCLFTLIQKTKLTFNTPLKCSPYNVASTYALIEANRLRCATYSRAPPTCAQKVSYLKSLV